MNLEEYLKKNIKSHLIFDLDETIAKMVIPWRRWEEGIGDELRKLGEKILEARNAGEINLSDMQNMYVRKFGRKMRDKIIKHNERFESKLVKRFEKNEPLIKQIKKLTSYKKYIWSSNTKVVVMRALSEAGITDCFEKIITRNDLTMIKPDIEGFGLIYDSSVPKSRYLFVGDSVSDKEVAKRAKIDFFQITYFGDNIRGR